MRIAALFTLVAMACATAQTTPNTAAAEGDAPEAVVAATLDGFRAEDWSVVEARLSAARKASLSETWFALWHAEAVGASRLKLAETRVAPDGNSAVVTVKLALNGQEHVTGVRLVKEGGAWKWDEQ